MNKIKMRLNEKSSFFSKRETGSERQMTHHQKSNLIRMLKLLIQLPKSDHLIEKYS